jgi:hypothetical protein
MPWSVAAEKWKDKMLCELFDKDKEQNEYEEMYESFLPKTDPLFNFDMHVEGILVPRMNPSDANSEFGLILNPKQAVIVKVNNKYPDLFQGDIITKVNGIPVRNGEIKKTFDEILALITSTDRNKMLQLDVLRNYRKGSRLGGMYRPDVYDARLNNKKGSTPSDVNVAAAAADVNAAAAADVNVAAADASTSAIGTSSESRSRHSHGKGEGDRLNGAGGATEVNTSTDDSDYGPKKRSPDEGAAHTKKKARSAPIL